MGLRSSVKERSTHVDVGALVRAAGGGDQEAWDALVARFTGMVWAITRNMGMTTADAADISQTAWLKLVQHIDHIEHPERVGAWLATTVRRECLRVKRLSDRVVAVDDDQLDSGDDRAAPLDARMLNRERDLALWDAFQCLPERARTLLELLTIEPSLSYKELSEKLDMPVGSIGPTRGRILHTLGRYLGERGVSRADAVSV